MFHQCPRCYRVYKQPQSLVRHEKYECGKEPGFSCPNSECTYKSKQPDPMKIHVRARHPELFEFYRLSDLVKPHKRRNH